MTFALLESIKSKNQLDKEWIHTDVNSRVLILDAKRSLKSLRSENHTPRFHLFNRSVRPYFL